jgi:asparagine synthase (glutamine-hydrolysing)
MCGIFGILNFDASPVERTALQAMARVSVHRGPDDEGLHIDGACGIGRRLDNIIERTVASYCIASLHGAQPANA